MNLIYQSPIYCVSLLGLYECHISCLAVAALQSSCSSGPIQGI